MKTLKYYTLRYYVPAIIKSWRIFNNWISLALKYALYRLGILYDYLAVRCGSSILYIEPYIYELIIRGYYLGFIYSIRCHGGRLIINGDEITFKKSNGYFSIGSARFKTLYKSILETFIGRQYDLVDVRGKVVVDVGAFVGDSAIYFALKGAKKVIAIEPHRVAFKEMLENIKLNNLENVIMLINAGLASKHGKICLKNTDIKGTESSYHGLGNCMNNVNVITLSEIIKIVGEHIVNSAILKMDCEGCEYDIILNDYENVRRFRELILEYHEYEKPISLLLNLLSKDFNCITIRTSSKIGIMYCNKSKFHHINV
jgi:FkbM family methyltransferase